jgi:Peptidase family M23
MVVPSWRMLGRLGLMALAVALAILSASRSGVAQVKAMAGSPRFLAFPSSDPAVVFNQAWYYEATGLKNIYCSFSGGDISGYGRHCAFDYSKRVSNTNVTFAVTAAAAGVAYRSSPSNGKLTIEHDQTNPAGRKFCTTYSHLDGGRPVIPVGKRVRVSRGQLVAWAGKTNTRSIHLHFTVRVGGCSGPAIDPYAIAAGLLTRRIAPVKAHYPRGTKFAGCGPNPLWLSCSR